MPAATAVAAIAASVGRGIAGVDEERSVPDELLSDRRISESGLGDSDLRSFDPVVELDRGDVDSPERGRERETDDESEPDDDAAATSEFRPEVSLLACLPLGGVIRSAGRVGW